MACECPLTQPGPTLAATCGGAPFMLFMGLLEVFLRSQCDIEDPCHRARPPSLFHDYDFIVVGGGSSGAVVASRLSEIPEWRVLLIEAGLDEPTGTQVPSMFLNFVGSSIDWGYLTEPETQACLAENEKRCYWPRGKVLGGTSTINGMMYIRGSRKDYDDWAAMGNEGWSYNEVLPHFLKSEDNKQMDQVDIGYHNQGGLLTVSQFPYHPPLSKSILKAAQELGYPIRDLNGRYHSGFAIAQTTNRNGSRMSTAKAFLRPFVGRKNLHILLNATVTKVLVNSKTKEAYGVELLRAGVKSSIYASKEVIISGGAVNSPQILLLSGIGPREELKKVKVPVVHDLPGVGKNLQNHVAFFINFFLNDTNTTPLNWATAMEYLLFRDGLMSGTGISEVTGFINTKYQDPMEEHPDIQYFFGGFLASCARTGQVGERTDNSSRSMQIIPTVIHPKSRGSLRLKDNNPLSHPLIFANYFTHPDDIKVMIEGIKVALRLSETKALRKYGLQLDKTPVPGCQKFSFGSDNYWECAVKQRTGPENHQVGSCKMGPPTDPLAVVNPKLQVHGVDRLRVIDASIMPKVPSGNTNAPCIMIAEKGSDAIKSRWLTPEHGYFFSNTPSQRIERHWGPW
ncbi:glucose dehydrogenase [FAD, quinone] [Diabrotica virgifera virgifera]|uniref:Glucose-methanol-choline oxidoreductase N-terminal domain-containing protein n=1 Tax=Diabrotica virgifera virgifera TaxID=50390 RepID=A0ABM5IGH6_DIAVI|nr:glucose dehydrogenase [FAD, quinone] [Diabrotica virgifera virgifera]XP_050503846.1 glucose dehydrogenase [FAD, quinone] [Diabrotica virgifera virgifera]XP_050503847.1 glucose dehydrogenase [FAD, quinone] [Diabrotica virgifera virgifera]